MAATRIEYEGQVYYFDLMAVGVEELREIKRKMKMTPLQFMEGVTQIDVDAMLALKWLILRSDGKHDDLVLGTPDSPFPDYWQFCTAYKDAQDDTEPEPDPTQAGTPPATSTPTSTTSSTPTLSSSSPGTSSPSPGTAGSVNGRSDDSPTPGSSPTSSALMP